MWKCCLVERPCLWATTSESPAPDPPIFAPTFAHRSDRVRHELWQLGISWGEEGVKRGVEEWEGAYARRNAALSRA